MPWERRTRRLLAQGVAWLALVSLGSWFAGCGAGHSTGEVLTVPSMAPLFTDEALFKDAVEVAQAKGLSSSVLTVDGPWVSLGRWSKVRVLAPAPGGYKVVVESALETMDSDPGNPRGLIATQEIPKLRGKIGWILAKDLETP
jgi:hypothetical protein